MNEKQQDELGDVVDQLDNAQIEAEFTGASSISPRTPEGTTFNNQSELDSLIGGS